MCPVLPRGSCRDRDVIHHRVRSVTFHRDRDNKTEMALDIGVALLLLLSCIPWKGDKVSLRRIHFLLFFLLLSLYGSFMSPLRRLTVSRCWGTKGGILFYVVLLQQRLSIMMDKIRFRYILWNMSTVPLLLITLFFFFPNSQRCNVDLISSGFLQHGLDF